MKNRVILAATAVLLAACGGGEAAAPDPVASSAPAAAMSPSDTPTPAMPEHGEGECQDDCMDDPAMSMDAFIELNAAGIDTDRGLIEFGSDAESAFDRLVAYWGSPMQDTGWLGSAGDCNVGDFFRTVTWGAQADTWVVFIDGSDAYDGAAHLASWVTSDPDQSTIAFVGDATTVSILAGHTTVGQMREQLGDAIEVDDQGPLGEAFYIEDNFGTLSGELTGLGDDDIVQSINAGSGCAE